MTWPEFFQVAVIFLLGGFLLGTVIGFFRILDSHDVEDLFRSILTNMMAGLIILLVSGGLVKLRKLLDFSKDLTLFFVFGCGIAVIIILNAMDFFSD
jgi:hypothetical protein